jgi:hypothetical protein
MTHLSGDQAEAHEASAMARALVTRMIELRASESRGDLDQSEEIQRRLAESDGASFALHLAAAFATLVCDALAAAAMALATQDHWEVAKDRGAKQPEFNALVAQVWTDICTGRSREDTAY